MSTVVAFHLSASLLALGAMAVAFLGPKGTAAHRAWGRLGALALLGAALSSFGITHGGRFSWIHGLSAVTLVTLALAVRAARRGDVRAHRRGMVILALSTLVAGTFAVAVPGRVLHAALFG